MCTRLVGTGQMCIHGIHGIPWHSASWEGSLFLDQSVGERGMKGNYRLGEEGRGEKGRGGWVGGVGGGSHIENQLYVHTYRNFE